MSELITDEYRALNAQLHKDRPDYGTSRKNQGHAARFKPIIDKLTWEFETFSVLDYGCGKGEFAKVMSKMPVHNYDPAIPEFSATPYPADIVICVDVMEHIEPELLDNVINDLKRVTNIALVVNIYTGPAKKTLADGRNAHLIQEPIEWWMEKFMKHFDLVQINGKNGLDVTMVLYKRVEH